MFSLTEVSGYKKRGDGGNGDITLEMEITDKNTYNNKISALALLLSLHFKM
jgi:hypothetical protein